MQKGAEDESEADRQEDEERWSGQGAKKERFRVAEQHRTEKMLQTAAMHHMRDHEALQGLCDALVARMTAGVDISKPKELGL